MRILSVRLLTMVSLVGCGHTGHGLGDGGNGGGGGSVRLKPNLDLTGVIGFAITPTVSKRAASGPATGIDAGACTASTLYAIQSNGDLVATTVTESAVTNDAGVSTCSASGTSTATETATAVYDTLRYVVITYDYLHVGDCSDPHSSACESCASVILRKSDGALFCDALSPNNPGSKPGGPSAVQADNGEHLFMRVTNASGGELVRLDMGVNPPTSTTINDPSITGVSVGKFNVDSVGDVLATLGTPPSDSLVIFKGTGGLQNVSASGDIFQWLGGDGAFYYTQYCTTTACGGNPVVNTFRVTTGLMSSRIGQIVLALPSSYYPGVCGSSFSLGGGGGDFGGLALDSTPSQAYAWDPTPGQAAIIELVGNTAGTEHIVSGVNAITRAAAAGSAIISLGTDSTGGGLAVETVFNLCPPSVLLMPGMYTITASSVSKTGELTFAGLRNSDGANVLGNCTTNGTGGSCLILDPNAPQVTQLQRIN